MQKMAFGPEKLVDSFQMLYTGNEIQHSSVSFDPEQAG